MKPIWYDDTGRAETKRAFEKSIEDHFGFGAEHLTVSYSTWNFSTWPEEHMGEIINHPKRMLIVLDKLWQELASTDRNTTIQPYETNIMLGIPKLKPIVYDSSLSYNIITTSGLVDMAKRETGEVSTTNEFCAVGTGTTTEALADVGLQTEVGPATRKAFDTDGIRAVSGTTERYGMPFSRSDFSADRIITEGAIFTKDNTAGSGECIARVTATGVTVTTGRIVTIQLDITNANGTTV